MFPHFFSVNPLKIDTINHTYILFSKTYVLCPITTVIRDADAVVLNDSMKETSILKILSTFDFSEKIWLTQ